jgi:hypothetical protein
MAAHSKVFVLGFHCLLNLLSCHCL